MKSLVVLIAIVAGVAGVTGTPHKGVEAEKQNSPWPLNEVYMVNDSLAWGVGNDGVIVRKVGGNWSLDTLLITRLDSLGDSDFTGVFFWDERHGWVIGNRKMGRAEGPKAKAIVLRTIDGGDNWEARFPFVPEGSRLLEVRFGTRYCGWILAENGYMLLTNDGGITWCPTYAGDKAHYIAR